MNPSKLARGYYVTDSLKVSNSPLTLTLLSSGFLRVAAGFPQKPTGFLPGYGGA